MDHGKDHHSSHNVVTQHGKKSHEPVDSKQHQAEENQAPRSGFQLGQVKQIGKRKFTFLNTSQGDYWVFWVVKAAAGYATNKAAELSTFGNTKDFEDLEAESRSNSGHDSEEQTEHTHEDDKDHHHSKK